MYSSYNISNAVLYSAGLQMYGNISRLL